MSVSMDARCANQPQQEMQASGVIGWLHGRSLVSVLVGGALWTGTAVAATTTGDLKVYVLNVGQGDAILIVCPHGTHRMLIDSGARG
jgi:beta-lactamase superfamily II metal-dependent hydrolase